MHRILEWFKEEIRLSAQKRKVTLHTGVYGFSI